MDIDWYIYFLYKSFLSNGKLIVGEASLVLSDRRVATQLTSMVSGRMFSLELGQSQTKSSLPASRTS